MKLNTLFFWLLISSLFFGEVLGSIESFCSCARSFKPICGNDENTYDNKCQLECAARNNNNLTLAYSGACCPQNICLPIRNPVCDSLGRTHVNECILQHIRCIQRKTHNRLIHKAHDGPCTPEERVEESCEEYCIHVGGPVCDEHGITHSDECHFEKANCKRRQTKEEELFLAYYGMCVEQLESIEEETRPELTTHEVSAPTLTIATSTTQKQFLILDSESADRVVFDHLIEEGSGEDQTTNVSILKKMEEGEIEIDFERDGYAEKESVLRIDEMPMGTVRVMSNNIRLRKSKDRQEGEQTTQRYGQKPHTNVRNETELHDNAEDQPNRSVGQSEKEGQVRVIGGELLSGTTEEGYLRANGKEDTSIGIDVKPQVRIADRKEQGGARAQGSGISSDGMRIGVEGMEEAEAALTSNTQMQPFDVTHPCSAAECDKTWNPVCDSNGKTHRNLCLFKFYSCKVSRVDGSTVELSYDGECRAVENEQPIECVSCLDAPRIPVCDNQNKTHDSLCAISSFNCLQKQTNSSLRILVHVGRCHKRSPVFELKDEICPPRCTADVKPVCDEMNVTHRNLCVFQQKNCHLRKIGEPAPMLKILRPCPDSVQKNSPTTTQSSDFSISSSSLSFKPPPTTTPTTPQSSTMQNITPLPSTTLPAEEEPPELRFDCPRPSCDHQTGLPVCDSKGRLHENICMFTFARCQAARRGEFLSIQPDEKCLQSRCDENCSDEPQPVCGSDFVTYTNLCVFKKHKCMDNRLDVLFNGPCSACLSSPCPVVPPDASDAFFVCDQNGLTRTLCEYQMLSCIVEKNYAVNLTIEHLGRCCDGPETCDSKADEPLCGNDRRTYRNKCQFDVENCRNEKLEVPIVSVLHEGECTIEEEGGEFESFDSILPETKSDEGDGMVPTKMEQTDDLLDQCPSSCDNSYAPVCGSDDVTYTNICVLKDAKCKKGLEIRIAYSGDCCEVYCPNNFSPVCDDQGTTHQNLCHFGKERCVVERTTGRNISIDKFDVCSNVDKCTMECPKSYEPICGSNGDTFVNICEMGKQNCFIHSNITTGDVITIDYEGECCSSEKCDYEFSPVCDSDGTTHANKCVFDQVACKENRKNGKNITVQYKGQCCNQPCENDQSPVCDGRTTHENMCRFRVAQCESERKGTVMALAYAGSCCDLPQGQCSTTGSVCDSDGQTHRNLCQFQQKKCVVGKTINKTISIVHAGECCSIEVCHKVNDPVCDTRGGTHASLCHFGNTKCIHDKIHPHNTIQLAYKGVCCPNECSSVWESVCDQHGSVYRNRCQLKVKACELNRRSGGILLETPCPQRRRAL